MTPSQLRDFDHSVSIALLRAREAVSARFKAHIEARGLTLPQWRVLRALAETGEMDVSSLARRCVVLLPSMTRIIKALEDAQLVHTRRAQDRRRRVVALTQQGTALYDELSGPSEEFYRNLEQGFGADRLTQLVNMLNELRETVEREKKL